MRIIALHIIGCLTLSSLNSQQLHFRTYEDEGSLQLQQPNCWVERDNGFIWIGDEQGLWQFDGFEFAYIHTQDSLDSQRVTALFEDPQGRIWIGYHSGAIYQAKDQQAPVPWEPEEGWPASSITGFAVDHAGNLWWSTYGEGVYCQRGKHVYQFGEEDGLSALDVYDIVADAKGRILVATDKGVTHLGWQDNQKTVRQFSKNDGLPDNIIRCLLPDEKGGCWVGAYEGGVAYLNVDSGLVRPLPASWPGGIVVGISFFEDDNLWVATADQGLQYWNAQRKEWQLSSNHTVNQQTLRGLYKDSESNLWVLSREQRIASTNAHFTFLTLTIPTPQAIAIDKNDGLWIGTAEGLFYYDQASQAFVPHLADRSLNVISLYIDALGILWVGTFGEDLLAYQIETQQLQTFSKANGLNNGNILDITGVEGELWLATLGGVFHLSYDHSILRQPTLAFFEHLEGEQALGTDFIYCAYVDPAGNTWFGTDGKGISQLTKDGRLHTFTERSDGSRVRSVYSIAQDGSGRIWISTESGEVLSLAEGKFQPSSFIPSQQKKGFISLKADKYGRLLLIHSNGIDVWDPTDESLVHFHGAVGFDSFEPNLNAVAHTQKGQLFIVGQEKLVQYTPMPRKARMKPKTILHDVAIFLEPLDFLNRTTLSAKENNLVFRFSGIWFTDPSLITYQYQLEGFDQSWISTEDQQAVYSNLPPGSYTFRVATTANHDFQEAEEARYSFAILAPLWKRPWFILLAIILVTGLLTYWLSQREKRLQREASLKKEKIESQYEALKSQINPHFLFNSFNTLVSLIEEQPGQAVSYVEKLADFYRGILQYRERDLVDLSEEVKMVQDYAFLLQQRYGTNFKLNIDLANNGYTVVPFSLQMLVENAVKHNIISRQHPLEVRIFQAGEHYLVVENPKQLKLTQERSTGFGIQSIKKRYGILTDQVIWIEDEPNHFRVGIPLLKPLQS